MKRNRALQILIWGLVLLSLACVILPKSVDNGVVTPAAASPLPILPTGTVPALTATSSPLEPPTTAAETQVSIPTATVFPEERLYTVIDQTKAIEVTVPTVWTDMRTLPWTDAKGTTIGTIFMVSTDVEAFLYLTRSQIAFFETVENVE